MIDKMIITVVCGILVIVLVVQLLLCSLPLFRRLEYDAICYKYTLMIDKSGGMTSRIASQLVQDLSESGFQVIQISGTGSADFGEELSLFVVSRTPGHRLNLEFSLEEVDLSLTYQSSTICRILKTSAAAP